MALAYIESMNTGANTVNTSRKRTQRTFALETAIIDDYAGLTCRQRKRLRPSIRARCKRLGHSTESKFDSVHVHVSGLRNLDGDSRNRSELTFRTRYEKHTLHSEAEHKTYYPVPPRFVGYKDPTGIDMQWENHTNRKVQNIEQNKRNATG